MNYPALPAYPFEGQSHPQPACPVAPAAFNYSANSGSNHNNDIYDRNTTSSDAMVPGYTAAPLPNHPLSTRCCCISMHGGDQIAFTKVPPEFYEPIREVIQQAWGHIQYDNRIGNSNSFEFKLRGFPWQSMGLEAVKARRLICQILKFMASHGWNLIQAADISKSEHNKDVMFFECQVQEKVFDSTVDMFAMSFNRSDCIRLIDCSPHLIPLVRDTIKKHWRFG